MNSKITVISVLLGLGLINSTVQASGLTGKTTNVFVSLKSETLSEVIQTLILKENSGTKTSSAILTISILEDYQKNNQKHTFNCIYLKRQERQFFDLEARQSLSHQPGEYHRGSGQKALGFLVLDRVLLYCVQYQQPPSPVDAF